MTTPIDLAQTSSITKESWWKLRLENDFTYHKPFGDQPQRYEEMRNKSRSLAELIVKNCPDSRERSLALTKLEEVVFWANASIARNEHELQKEEAK